MNPPPSICVFGAGSVGCYVGGRLLAAGAAVRFVGRPDLMREIKRSGLRLSDLYGADIRVAAGEVDVATEDPGAASGVELVLVTVKSGATAAVARQLNTVLSAGACVLSLQNGLRNAEILQAELLNATVLTGMIPFNVVNRGGGAFHQGSAGVLMAERHAALSSFLAAFTAAGLPLHPRGDMPMVQWGKLLLNLNNSINALSGLPLKAELSQRAYRRCLALAQREALRLLDQAKLRPAALTPLPTHWFPRMLELPDFVFRRAANRMLAIDPLARSSMWDDLEAGRHTEIEWLNGEVMRLAAHLGRSAPVNARLSKLIHEAEQGGPRDWPGMALLRDLQAAHRSNKP